MPENFSLKTEVGNSSNIFIVDDFGGFSSSLVDSLMERGFEIYYFGVEKKEAFSYLLHKKNFIYLENFEEIQSVSKIEYIFYFPKNTLDVLKSTFTLSDKFSSRVIIATQNSFYDLEKITDLVNFQGANVRLILFENLFGPRITEGVLPEIFSQAVKEKKIVLSWNEKNKFRPLFSKLLVKELLKLSFLPDSRGKVYFLEPEKCTYQEFFDYLKESDPTIEVSYLDNKPKNESYNFPEEAEEVEILDNLEEAISETYDWFLRNKKSVANEKPLEIEEVEEMPMAQNRQLFSTEIIEETKEEVPTSNEIFTPPVEEKIEEKKESSIDFLFKEPKLEVIPLATEVISEKGEEKVEPVIEQTPAPVYVPVEEALPKKKKSVFKKIVISILLFLLLIILFFVVPSFITITTGINGAKKIEQAKTDFDNGNFNAAQVELKEGTALLGSSQKTLSIISPFLSLIGLEKKTTTIGESFLFLQEVGESTQSILQTFQEISDSGQKFVNGSDVDWLSQIENIKANLLYAYEKASLAQSSLKSSKDGFIWINKENQYDGLSSFLPEIREKLLKARNLTTVIPDILGLKERKTYLVLFQNNLELRPTGGFIPAFGLLNIENGKLIDFEISDIYQADQELKGQVEPPKKIKEVLGENVWYFRDSNWDPDFSASAQRALWFLDKEMKVSADGVLAVNLKVFENVLAKLGEVTLTDYPGEAINAGNLESKIIQYSDTSSLAGANKKQEFMVSLANAVFEKVKTLDSQKFINIEGTIFSSLETKEMMFYSDDPVVQKGIVDLGWDGNLRNYQPKVESFNVFSDYLFIDEANLGVNKVNFVMKRNVNHEITIDELGKVQEKLVLEYENQSPSDNWPLGKYRNYLRIYLPQGTNLVSALTTDTENNGIWVPVDSSLQEVFDEHGKTVLAFMLDIPAKSSKKLEVTYNLANGLDLSKKINSYLLLVQKQSGSYSDVYNLTFNSSKELVPLRVIPKAIVDNGRLIIGEKINKDKIFQIDLAH